MPFKIIYSGSSQLELKSKLREPLAGRSRIFIIQSEAELSALEVKWSKKVKPRSFGTFMKFYPEARSMLINKDNHPIILQIACRVLFYSVVPPEMLRGHSGKMLEAPAEMKGIAVAHRQCYLCNCQTGSG